MPLIAAFTFLIAGIFVMRVVRKGGAIAAFAALGSVLIAFPRGEGFSLSPYAVCALVFVGTIAAIFMEVMARNNNAQASLQQEFADGIGLLTALGTFLYLVFRVIGTDWISFERVNLTGLAIVGLAIGLIVVLVMGGVILLRLPPRSTPAATSTKKPAPARPQQRPAAQQRAHHR